MMKNLYSSDLYLKQLKKFSKNPVFNTFSNKNFLLTGGTGLILSLFIDTLLENEKFKGCIYCIVRSKKKAYERFAKFIDDERLIFIELDINSINSSNFDNLNFDFVISGASYTCPSDYANFPVDVINTNYSSVLNLLELSKKKKSLFLFLSSTEVYGINEKQNLVEDDISIFKTYEVRSCYNLAKALCENLCFSYASQYNVNFQIIRFSRVYGPTMKRTDTKAMSQFINNALSKQNIILKSAGEQLFNYQFVFDSVLATAYVLNSNFNNQIFNCTCEEIMTLKEIANIIANISSTKVEIKQQDEFNGKGYSKVKTAIMDITKLKNLGFRNKYNLKEGITLTLNILKDLNN